MRILHLALLSEINVPLPTQSTLFLSFFSFLSFFFSHPPTSLFPHPPLFSQTLLMSNDGHQPSPPSLTSIIWFVEILCVSFLSKSITRCHMPLHTASRSPRHTKMSRDKYLLTSLRTNLMSSSSEAWKLVAEIGESIVPAMVLPEMT